VATINGNNKSNILVGTQEASGPGGWSKTADTINGYGGNDELHGRFGDDYLNGGDGNDKLWGDAGNDWLVGGKGNDQVIFAWQMGDDTIEDFKVAGVNNKTETDSIQLYDLYADGQWFHTNYEWLAPTDANGDGKLDAVLHLYSQLDRVRQCNAVAGVIQS
jgi:Ca2+-binding RTX toxin-like protein